MRPISTIVILSCVVSHHSLLCLRVVAIIYPPSVILFLYFALVTLLTLFLPSYALLNTHPNNLLLPFLSLSNFQSQFWIIIKKVTQHALRGVFSCVRDEDSNLSNNGAMINAPSNLWKVVGVRQRQSILPYKKTMLALEHNKLDLIFWYLSWKAETK